MSRAGQMYAIEREVVSESASLLFAKDLTTNEPVVIKILREYKDALRNLQTISLRQQCQVEALRWNQIFTPQAYLGLGSILQHEQNEICLGDIVSDPDDIKRTLDPQKDYALVMNLLPEDRWLDHLLREEKEDTLQPLIQTLFEYIAYMHRYLVGSCILTKNGAEWGSYEQIQKKLEHNLEFFDLVTNVTNTEQYKKFFWVKDALRQIVKEARYRQYVEQRLQAQYIKRCHGDLKLSNIWIIPHDRARNEEYWKYVRVLDAIDFEPLYYNIDILSDFAMLITDIQSTTKSSSLVDYLIEGYLELTGQGDEVSRAILVYYLVEKALVRATVGIMYNDSPELSVVFFEMAEKYMKDLISRLHTVKPT